MRAASEPLQPTLCIALEHIITTPIHQELIDSPAWLLTILNDRLVEPNTYRQAKKSPECALWDIAMDKELASHELKGSFKPAHLPPGHKALPLKWIYKFKYDDASSVTERKIATYKARLCIVGCHAEYGIDYEETFSPVIRAKIIRILLTIAATDDLECHQMDVKTAFLNANADRPIYVTHPPGFPTTTIYKHP